MSELLLDNHARRLDNIEKRLARLESAAGPAWTVAPPGYKVTWTQFCPCGRDVCRAPDCPSHKPDPLGR